MDQPLIEKPYEIQKTRIMSVDILRGLTIAFMILVNDPGDWAHVYAPLRHAEWNGWTPTDLVFPSFMFIMGCVIPFSLGSRIDRGVPSGELLAGIVRRSLILFGIDILLALFPHFDFANLRVLGVLTRFAVCYLICGTLFLKVRDIRVLCGIVATILVLYWVLLRFVPIPGIGMPGVDVAYLDDRNNIVAWMDRAFNDFCREWFHFGHLYRIYRDPEGILSTFPALCTVLIGIVSGLVMKAASRNPDAPVVRRWALGGAGLFVLSFVVNAFFPFNKNIWSSSFVLLCAGIDIMALYALFILIDVRQVYRLSAAVRGFMMLSIIFGSNAIVAYCVSEFGSEILWDIHVMPQGQGIGEWMYRTVFAHWGSTELTSLFYACAYVALCFIPSFVLWKKKIVVKI